jgi:peroxiredoxin
MLSDESGEARKAYSVSRGLMGMSEGRVTFFVDSEGVVRYVTAPFPPPIPNIDVCAAVTCSIR